MVVTDKNHIAALNFDMISHSGFTYFPKQLDILWSIEGEIDGYEIDPHGVTGDNNDSIFVADGKNRRVLEFNKNGHYKRTVLNAETHGVGFVYGVNAMVEAQSTLLLVLHAQPDQTLVIEHFIIN